MENPIVSIVIPALNEEKYIDRCLSSLKAQTYQNFEIIISDGGSTDKTKEIAKKYGVQVIVSHHLTIPFARQRGIDVSSGKIMVGADADTCYPPNYLAKIVDNFSKDPSIVAVGGPSRFPKRPWWVHYGWRFVYDVLNPIKTFFGIVPYIPAFNLSFRKKTFKKIGGYNCYIDYGGDEIDIIERLKKEGKIYYDRTLCPLSSNRRSKVGFIRFLFKEGVIDYYVGYILAKIFKRTIIRGKPVR